MPEYNKCPMKVSMPVYRNSVCVARECRHLGTDGKCLHEIHTMKAFKERQRARKRFEQMTRLP